MITKKYIKKIILEEYKIYNDEQNIKFINCLLEENLILFKKIKNYKIKKIYEVSKNLPPLGTDPTKKNQVNVKAIEKNLDSKELSLWEKMKKNWKKIALATAAIGLVGLGAYAGYKAYTSNQTQPDIKNNDIFIEITDEKIKSIQNLITLIEGILINIKLDLKQKYNLIFESYDENLSFDTLQNYSLDQIYDLLIRIQSELLGAKPNDNQKNKVESLIAKSDGLIKQITKIKEILKKYETNTGNIETDYKVNLIKDKISAAKAEIIGIYPYLKNINTIDVENENNVQEYFTLMSDLSNDLDVQNQIKNEKSQIDAAALLELIEECYNVYTERFCNTIESDSSERFAHGKIAIFLFVTYNTQDKRKFLDILKNKDQNRFKKLIDIILKRYDIEIPNYKLSSEDFKFLLKRDIEAQKIRPGISSELKKARKEFKKQRPLSEMSGERSEYTNTPLWLIYYWYKKNNMTLLNALKYYHNENLTNFFVLLFNYANQLGLNYENTFRTI